MRRCSKCGECKPLAEFGRDPNGPLGYHRTCKPCIATSVTSIQRCQRVKAHAFDVMVERGLAPPITDAAWDIARARASTRGGFRRHKEQRGA